MYGDPAVHDLGFIKRLHGSVLQTLLAALRVFLYFLSLHSFFSLQKRLRHSLKIVDFQKILIARNSFRPKKKTNMFTFWLIFINWNFKDPNQTFVLWHKYKTFIFYHFIKKGIGLRVSKLISIHKKNYHNSVQINTQYSGGLDPTRVVSIFFPGENFHAVSGSEWYNLIAITC